MIGAFIGGALLGAAAGSVTPRVAFRFSVPYGEAPRVGCPTCATPFPAGVRGWLRPGGRCPDCRARLGPRAGRYALVGAAACGTLASVLRPGTAAAFLLAAVVGLLLAAIDLACLRLPDQLVFPLYVGCVATLATVAGSEGLVDDLVRALEASVALAAVYLVLGILLPTGVGFGDVKLALVTGLLLGWLGWGFVLAGTIVAQLVHGAVSIGTLIARRGGMRTIIPMGPALLFGAWFAALVPAFISWYTRG